MKHVIEKIHNQMALEKMPDHNPVNNQDGSIILVAMMVLVIMTVIGLMSSSTVVTENFIIRNEAIHRQNMNMVEAAMMEQLQQFMQLQPNNPNIVDVNTSGLAWINNIKDAWAANTWYAGDSSARILDVANSIDINTSQNLADRGEAAAGNLRAAFVGWDIVQLPEGGSESLGVGANKAVWRRGRLLAEYVSRNAGGEDHGYGMLRMEIGVKRRIVIN